MQDAMNAPDTAPDDGMSAEQRRALMSSLADGELAALPQACRLWRDDAASRAAWHSYHLIGDVLRSSELAGAPQRDTALLAAVRKRLASEPTVLAPAPEAAGKPAHTAAAVPARQPRRQAWLAPAAVAAGFVAVAGVLVVTRLSAPPTSAPLLAASPASGMGLSYAGNGVPGPQPLAGQGRLIRDARLDSYFLAHRQALGGVPAAVPGGMPRSIETLAPVTPMTPMTPMTSATPATPVSTEAAR